MRVREYRRGDAEAVQAIFRNAVLETGRRHYTEQQVQCWAAHAPDPSEYDERARDGRVFLVATDDGDVPIAYIDLEPNGHIDHLFCRPDRVGKGIASALYDKLENIASQRGIPNLHVEASEGSRPLFLRKGFTELRRRDFFLAGVAVHNYAMVKALTPAIPR